MPSGAISADYATPHWVARQRVSVLISLAEPAGTTSFAGIAPFGARENLATSTSESKPVLVSRGRL